MVASSILPLAVAIPLFTACRPDPVQWNVEIAAATLKSGRLDLIGINQFQKAEYWDGLSVDDYWQRSDSVPGNIYRLTFDFTEGKINLVDARGVERTGVANDGSKVVTIPREHPIWRRWFENNAAGLVAIGRFPGGRSGPAGGADPRKRLLPLFKQCWDSKDRTLRLEIQDNGPVVVTPPARKAPRDCF